MRFPIISILSRSTRLKIFIMSIALVFCVLVAFGAADHIMMADGSPLEIEDGQNLTQAATVLSEYDPLQICNQFPERMFRTQFHIRCDVFVFCVFGSVFIMECPKNFYFDGFVGQCVTDNSVCR
ncbi:uncharacterized protein LOC132705628 [Cylas formicarius]|uniref:uncharacterized protein LOC132705628 n=1 Tax=Cylas formicarius TaxID=197179 RepID=UPI002958920C|nr:uncharacterized protein LOC132705628 [Cylas formicarius]